MNKMKFNNTMEMNTLKIMNSKQSEKNQYFQNTENGE